MILRANLFRRLEKLLSFARRQRNSLDLRRLRGPRETAEARGGIHFDDARFDGLVEYPADHAQRVPDRVARQLLLDQRVNHRLDVVAFDLIERSVPEARPKILLDHSLVSVGRGSLAFDSCVVLQPLIRVRAEALRFFAAVKEREVTQGELCFELSPDLLCERLIQRRSTRTSLGAAEINEKIVERFYQQRAIRSIGEAFEKDHERKSLVVMATGAGKTRTVIALCDLMMRCNWVKRVLFLADRIALVKQTTNVFKKQLPSAAAVNVLEHPEQIGEARVLVSTYPTMLRLIDETKDGRRQFGPGHFDLVIIDEAHRSVYQKYRAIFEYFDSFLVGLTATPKDEVDHNTYGLFDLEDGVPTDAYGLEEAVKDGFLVPPKAVSVPLKFQRGGHEV